jgi:predicted dienelactone hydrolase
MRYAAPITLLIAIVQVLVEGQRWQMVPAYVLAGFCFVFWLLHHTATRTQRPNWVAIGMGVCWLVISISLPIILPVFRFPPPTGPYGIGTVTYHWLDTDRPEIFSTDPKARRELMVQIWYPAKADRLAPRAPYMADADAVMAVFAHIHAKPEFIFGHFKYVTTNAMLSAPVADDEPSYPVLLFLEGVTGFRQMNTFQVEELVSHGYIVAAIDQPGAAADVVFPDGHQVVGLSLDQMGLIRQSYLPAEQAPILNGQAFENGIIPYLAQDVTFMLNQLSALNEADPNGILTGRLDLLHIGIFGVSLGGIIVGEACRLEPRLQACLVMDAPMPADVVHSGLQQPAMWITRDAETMRLERERAGGWSEAEIQAHLSTMRAVYQSLQGSGYFVQVAGMFHSNFMDIPNWFPLASQLGLTGPIDGQQAHDIVNAYSLAFFDRHLKGQAATLLDRPAEHDPDVILETR